LSSKPTLTFFQYQYDNRLPSFLLTHKDEHVRCLSQFFNVVVIDYDCDYQQICDIYEPDLALFESGVPFPSCNRPKITNPRACPQTPKLGFMHSDAFCIGRAGFLSDMDHLGIETYFAIATRAAENTPVIADSLFIWPNFVNAEVYRDYDLWKSIPVLFVGNSTALYPWRQKMARIIPKHYPSMICTHPGYSPQKKQQQTRVGESYARMLNASLFVPSCGTLAKEVVRKHFEVPACKACLVAEPSRTLEAAGFIDMVNCVLAEEHDVLDKLSFLFQNPDELERIIQAGYDLVHQHHTIKQRDQILQWYELNKILQPHEKIVQPGPFEPLRVVDRSYGRGASDLVPEGLHLQILRQGDRLLGQHDYAGAERCYLRCLQHIPYLPEPKVRLALCNLHKGNAKRALSWISEPIQFTLSEYRALDPDPVEWAYFIISTICSGNLREAAKRGDQFVWLRHPELDRARRATMILSGQAMALPREDGPPQRYRRSIHQLAKTSDEEWFVTLCDLLGACNRHELAERLRNHFSGGGGAFKDERASNEGNEPIGQQDKGADSRLRVASQGTVKYFDRRLWYSQKRENLRKAFRRLLHRVEAKSGYFLPHRVSSSRSDEFYEMIYDLARGEKAGTALVLGADWRGRSTQALIAGFREREEEALTAGIREGEEQSRVFCVRIGKRGRRPRTGGWKETLVKWYGPLLRNSSDMGEQLEKAIVRIREENDVMAFDLVLIDGRETIQEDVSEGVYDVLRGARYVLLGGVGGVSIHEIYRRLQREGRHRVTGENPDLRNGYAVLERRECEVVGS